VFRIESAKIIAGLAKIVRDVGVAEELAQDALVSALEHWPDDGLPDNPGAWLMATAKNRALDRLRRWLEPGSDGSLPDQYETQWTVDNLPTLLEGTELATARLVVASLDPDLDLLAHRAAHHG